MIVHLNHGDYSYLVGELLGAELDLLVSDRVPTEAESNDLEVAAVYEPRMIVVAAPQLAAQVERFPQDLDGIPLINYTPQTKYRLELDARLREWGVFPQVIGETDHVGVMTATAVAMLCVAVVPEDSAKSAIANGSLQKIADFDESAGTVFAIFRQTEPDPNVVRAVEQLRRGSGFVAD